MKVVRTDYQYKNPPRKKLSNSYKTYLHSPEWFEVRDKILARAHYQCEQCGSKGFLNIHHLTYKHFKNELYYPQDLICLCIVCHNRIHGIKPPKWQLRQQKKSLRKRK